MGQTFGFTVDGRSSEQVAAELGRRDIAVGWGDF